MSRLRVSFFPGVAAWPLWAALDGGTFARAALEVVLEPTPSSAELFARLDRGDYDIAHAAIDNPIAYDVGMGAVPTAARDFVAFFGVDAGGMQLIARPGVTSIAALSGKTAAVDALSTGFAFALRAMLDTEGLDGAVTLAPRGGTAQRYRQLIAGDFDATLLAPPYDLQALERGFVTLGTIAGVVGRYQGVVAIARRGWLAAHRDNAVAYLTTYRAALDLLAGDRVGAIALLQVHEPDLSGALAAQCYDAAFAPGAGFRRDACIDLDGVRTVLRLRARYAPPGAGDDPSAYIDPSILAATLH